MRGPLDSTTAGVRSRSSVRAGVTLIEIVIVITVLALIAGIAWPAVRGAWFERSFAASADIVEHALSGARLDAVRRGEVLIAEVEALEEGGQAIVVRPLAEADDGGAVVGDVESIGFRRTELLALPVGIRIEEPVEEEDEAGASLMPFAAAPGELPEPVAVATFFPDGSAAAGTALVLVDGRGRRARIEVGAVTGRVTLVRDDEPAEGAERGDLPPLPEPAP